MARRKDITKVNNLYQAGMEIIMDQGIGGIKMSQIAQKAGVATGTVYIYFKNKRQFIENTYARVVENARNQIIQNLDDHPNFLSEFRQLWRNYIQYCINHPHEVAFLEQVQRSVYKDKLANVHGTVFQQFFDTIEKGKLEGHIIPVRTDLLVIHIIGSINEIVNSYMADRISLTSNDFQLIYNLTWNSIRL